MNWIIKHKLEVVTFLFIVAAYFLLRLPNLTLQPIFADEAIYIRWAQVMRAEQTLRFLSLSDGKTPLFMWFMIPIFKFFNDPLFAGRFLSILSGFVTLCGVWALSWKVFGKKSAIWASLLYAITPYTVFFDRMALVDSMFSAFTLWSIYFAIWLMQTLRLDLSMILGYFLGGAILTKTPGMISILISPISLLALKKMGGKYPLVKALLFLGIAILIGLIMYNLLRLGPNFQLLSSRNSDYVFSLWELKGRPLDPFIPHFHDISDWFPKLFTWPILGLMVYGLWFMVKTKNRLGWVVFLWGLIPLLLEMAFLRTFTARYLLSSVAPFLIFAGFGLTKVFEKIKMGKFSKIFISLILILPLSLKFDYQLLLNPPPLDLPKEERRGYFEDWTSGYGFKDIANYLIDQKKNGPVLVGTEGFFGTLPDGLQIYLDKANISIIGSSATISAQIRDAVDGHLVFFVGNKNRLKGRIRNAKLIKEYSKAVSLDDGSLDAIVLYKVLPEK